MSGQLKVGMVREITVKTEKNYTKRSKGFSKTTVPKER